MRRATAAPRVATFRRRRSWKLSALMRDYTDVAFMWARKNADMARACLKVPPLSQQTQVSCCHHSFTNFEEYWQECRNWDFSSVENHPHERKWAQRLVSHVLSAPLTLAHHFPSSQQQKPSLRICIVGARAEATLPLDYWREILVATTTTSNNNANKDSPYTWGLDFVGPEVVSVQNHVTLKHGTSTLTIRWLNSGYLHDMPDKPPWDGFVLFNPGLGHNRLQQGWVPTLEFLLRTSKPVLLTAHSKCDAHRDATVLQKLLGRPVPYHENAFASRITYKDPNDNHLIHSNMFYARI